MTSKNSTIFALDAFERVGYLPEKHGISLSSVSRIVKREGQQHGQEQGIQTKGKTERQKRIEDLERRIAISQAVRVGAVGGSMREMSILCQLQDFGLTKLIISG